MTEIDAVTGALVQILKSHRYGLDTPGALTSDGKDVWVSNDRDQSLTGFPV